MFGRCFSKYWIFLILGVLFILWCIFGLPNSDLNAARWTLSALVQSIAALVGLIIVGMTLLWTQAITEEGNLRRMKDSYMNILLQMHELRGDWTSDVSIIEQLRQDYLEKLKSSSLPDEIFTQKHTTYKNHKDLFTEICALAVFVQSYFNIDKKIHKQRVNSDLKAINLFNKSTFVDKRSLIMKRNVVDFFFVLYDIFTPDNLTLDKLNQGKTLSDKIWNSLLNDNVDLGLERIKRFRIFKGTFFKVNMFAFILTLVVGLLILSSLSDSNFTPSLLLLPMILGIISIALLTITLNRLLHSD